MTSHTFHPLDPPLLHYGEDNRWNKKRYRMDVYHCLEDLDFADDNGYFY